ncbi:hypothetical protein [Actinoplanes sp. NPDC049265]|uniref:hypothetical protein n=1 Tax=Actinoplanes sp. NPDC049265 TaxID=3363902 RepID=UPI003717CABB
MITPTHPAVPAEQTAPGPDSDAEQPATTPAEPAGTEQPSAEDNRLDGELPEWARKRLTRANAEAANYRTRLREAEARLDGAKTAEEYEQAVADIKTRNAELEQQLARERVARKFSLPNDLAERLHGGTVEELEADAAKLQKYAAPAEPVALSGGLDPTDDSDTETDPRVLARRYGGRRR